MKTHFFGSVALLAASSLTTTARAEVIGGVDFPQGPKSFADRVVSLSYGSAAGVQPPYDDASQALGVPDVFNDDDPFFVALGNTPANGTRSELVLEFVDNRLIDIDGPDLYVFEVGQRVESTELAISVDGEQWFELGALEGSTREVDLATFDILPEGALFRFVRLRDRVDGSTSGSPFGGPDIDAVGAIGADVQDSDADGIHDNGDNCPNLTNANQADDDVDAVGNTCDLCRTIPGSAANDGCPNGASPDATPSPADAGAVPSAHPDETESTDDVDMPSGVQTDPDASEAIKCSCRLPGSQQSNVPQAAGFMGALGLLVGLVALRRRRANSSRSEA